MSYSHFQCLSGSDPFNFAESLLSVIDLVFTTVGTSSWEYLFLGIPTAVAYAANNQQTNYQYLVNNSLAIDIGMLDSRNNWNINKLIY